MKNNILLGRPFNKSKFERAVAAACLEPDFASWPLQEETLVGNKGATLSGGQKARIAIARALYSEADLFLLDDPLATLDKRVATSVVERGIVDMLQGKTVIMATQAVLFLPYFDHIIVLDKGQVVFEGNFFEFQSTQHFERSSFVHDLDIIEEEMEEEMKEQIGPDQSHKPKTLADTLSVYLEKSYKNNTVNPEIPGRPTTSQTIEPSIIDQQNAEDKKSGEISLRQILNYIRLFTYSSAFLVLISRIHL